MLPSNKGHRVKRITAHPFDSLVVAERSLLAIEYPLNLSLSCHSLPLPLASHYLLYYPFIGFQFLFPLHLVLKPPLLELCLVIFLRHAMYKWDDSNTRVDSVFLVNWIVRNLFSWFLGIFEGTEVRVLNEETLALSLSSLLRLGLIISLSTISSCPIRFKCHRLTFRLSRL